MTHVLLTGATGMVGREVLARAAADPRYDRITCLIRPALLLTPSDRLRRTLHAGLVYRPYLELRLRFDTRAAGRLLQPAGVSCTPVADFIDTVVQAALDSGFGRRASG